jgi:hypothetical protein
MVQSYGDQKGRAISDRRFLSDRRRCQIADILVMNILQNAILRYFVLLFCPVHHGVRF